MTRHSIHEKEKNDFLENSGKSIFNKTEFEKETAKLTTTTTKIKKVLCTFTFIVNLPHYQNQLCGAVLSGIFKRSEEQKKISKLTNPTATNTCEAAHLVYAYAIQLLDSVSSGGSSVRARLNGCA